MHRTAGRTARTVSRRGGVAFGLISLLVVILIIGLLYSMQTGGSSYTQQVTGARRQSVEVGREIATQQLSIIIAQYRQESNKLPKTAADMDAASAFRDEWGNEITFTFKDEGGVTRVTYKSNGPDGEPGTEDDLTRTDTLPF